MEYARIEANYHGVLRGRGYYTYDWVGPKTAPALIASWLDSAWFELLPWPVREIECDTLIPSKCVVRTDVGGGLPALWMEWRIKTHRLRVMLKARVIITLMVWGLAWVDEAVEPRWSDIGKKRP
jgi:hypothetical protein